MANTEVEHAPPGLYEGVANASADLLIPGIRTEFDHKAADFCITKAESNDALAARSTGVPLVAALLAEQAKVTDYEMQSRNRGFASFEFVKLPFVIETSSAWSVKAVAPWKRIRKAHKAAVADGFASSTFLNTKQAHTWSAFTLGPWYPQMISFVVRKWMAKAVHAGINSAVLRD